MKMTFGSKNYGVLILAAGASQRLGTPKQLVEGLNGSLINNAIKAAEESEADSVFIVLGANADSIKETLFIGDKSTQILINDDWNEGMNSSIRLGVKALNKHQPGLDALIIMVCDQPAVNASHLNALIRLHNHQKVSIVASKYAAIKGVPVLFDREYFEDLENLRGDDGAKSIIQKYSSELQTIPLQDGEVDIDTPEDLRNWQHEE